MMMTHLEAKALASVVTHMQNSLDVYSKCIDVSDSDQKKILKLAECIGYAAAVSSCAQFCKALMEMSMDSTTIN